MKLKSYRFFMEITQVNSRGVPVNKILITMSLTGDSEESAKQQLELIFKSVQRKRILSVQKRD